MSDVAFIDGEWVFEFIEIGEEQRRFDEAWFEAQVSFDERVAQRVITAFALPKGSFGFDAPRNGEPT